jgi:uncharacterized protein YjdB
MFNPFTWKGFLPMSAFKPVTNITMSPELTQLIVGQKMTFTATVAPSDATNQTIVWSRVSGASVTIESSNNGKTVHLTALSSGLVTLRATIANGILQ